MLQRLIALISLFVASNAASAQLAPATLGDPEAEKHWIRLIEWPETHGDATVNLDCVAIVKGNGRVRESFCYIKNNWDPDFAEAVQKAGRKAELVPATDGRKGREVGVHFRVLFLKREEDTSITFHLNPGIEENVQEYGEDHIGAQRVLGKETWNKACPKRARWLVMAKGFVGEDGRASSVDLEHRGGLVPTGPCVQAVIDTVESSEFAPATVDGVAVPSSYWELFGTG